MRTLVLKGMRGSEGSNRRQEVQDIKAKRYSQSFIAASGSFSQFVLQKNSKENKRRNPDLKACFGAFSGANSSRWLSMFENVSFSCRKKNC